MNILFISQIGLCFGSVSSSCACALVRDLGLGRPVNTPGIIPGFDTNPGFPDSALRIPGFDECSDRPNLNPQYHNVPT